MGLRTTLMRSSGSGASRLHFDTATVSQFNTNAKHTAWVWLGSSSNKPMALYYAEKMGEAGHSAEDAGSAAGGVDGDGVAARFLEER